MMAHPPSRDSNLTFKTFYETISSQPNQKIMKLDFKEIEVVEPCLEIMRQFGERNPIDPPPLVYLNADIFPGPGARGRSATVPAEQFFKSLFKHSFEHSIIDKLPFLSLGWSTHVARIFNPSGHYTAADVKRMVEVIDQYELRTKSHGFVFAVNARISMHPVSIDNLNNLLEEVEGSQLLIWTGTGEPPIREVDVEFLKAEFSGVIERIGFDCAVSESFTEGFVAAVKVFGINCVNYFRDLEQLEKPK